MKDTATIGERGEEAAACYLEESGYRLLGRNFSNASGIRLGEIDIVAEQEGYIVFVEVKTSLAKASGEEILPEWRVTRSKLSKLEKAAAIYMKEKRLLDRDYRFDVVSVLLQPDGTSSIRHIESAFL